MFNVQLKWIGVLVLIATASGCSTYGNPPPQAMGESFAHVAELQTANPERPESAPVPQMNGVKAGNVIRTYQADVGQPQAVRQAITVNVGD